MPRRFSEKQIVIATRVGTVAATTTFAFLLACNEPKKDAALSPSASAIVSAPLTTTATPAASSAPTPTAAADGGKSAKEAECDALLDDANSDLDAERIAVDKVCKTDADCVGIKGRACGFNCVTGAIPKAEEKDWNQEVAKVKANQCRKWDANDCIKLRTKAPPTCKDRKVWCDHGHCSLKEAT